MHTSDFEQEFLSALNSPSVLDRMIKYREEKHIPFHMPGHKRYTQLPYLKTLVADLDFSEIEGMDDLHQPKEMFKNTMTLAKKLWESKNSYLSIAGSTAMILSGIRSLTEYGDSVLVARNCHRSVYHAIELCGLRPVYVLPEFIEEYGITSQVHLEDIQRAFEQAKHQGQSPSLLVLTCPNYEGIFSDLKSIVAYAHQVGMKVLIDEAHGAHVDLYQETMLFSEDKAEAPCSALKAGADFVVQSLHKTLPSHTSTAICHLQGETVDESKLRHQLKIFQTSSPNYLLMASIDSCIRYLHTEEAKKKFHDWKKLCLSTRKKLSALKQLKLFGQKKEDFKKIFAYDFSKFVISTRGTNFSGLDLGQALRGYGIEVEMMNKDYVICMSGMLNTKAHHEKLIKALFEIDAKLSTQTPDERLAFRLEEQVLSPTEAYASPSEWVSFEQAEGRIAAEFIWAYPPGIPLIVPGEKINSAFIEQIEKMQKVGLNLQPQELEKRMIKVLAN